MHGYIGRDCLIEVIQAAHCALRLLALSAWVPMAVAHAPEFPSRILHIVVPLTPGSAADSTARFVAERLASELKQAVVVDNKPGGDMIIGVQSVLSSPADGYTLLLITPSNVVINPLINKELPYKPDLV